MLVVLGASDLPESKTNTALGVEHAVLNVRVQLRLVVIQLHLLVQKVHKLLAPQVIKFKVEVVRVERVCHRFVIRVVELCEVWVLKGFCYCDPALWRHDKHFLQ